MNLKPEELIREAMRANPEEGIKELRKSSESATKCCCAVQTTNEWYKLLMREAADQIEHDQKEIAELKAKVEQLSGAHSVVGDSDDTKGGLRMERLTFEGNFCDIARCKEVKCPYDTACSQKQVWERLKAYEDTGLTPEEIKAQFTEDAMINLAAQALGVEPSRLRELAVADKDGRVVVLPCKVGDTVYFALLGRIIEKQVFSIVSFSNSTRIYCGGTSEYFRPEDIGKTFFLARKEAEKALEGIEGMKE